MPSTPPIRPQMSQDMIGQLMESGAMQKAQQQKASTSTTPDPANILSTPNQPNLAAQAKPSQPFTPQQTPRDVGSMTDEAKLAVGDVVDQLTSLPTDIWGDVKTMLGLAREPKTQEEVAKAKAFHSRFSELDAQQQEVARERIRAEMERKKQEEELEKQKKAQLEEQKKNNQLEVPKGKVSGQAALDKMANDRKSGNMSGSG